jgi:hypothetical protein
VAEPSRSRGLLRGLSIALFGGILAYLLVGEHRVHVLGYLPFLFLLACPLMHLTHGHGGHAHQGSDAQRPQAPSAHQHPSQGGLDAQQ